MREKEITETFLSFQKNFLYLLMLILECFNLGFIKRLQIVFIAWIDFKLQIEAFHKSMLCVSLPRKIKVKS